MSNSLLCPRCDRTFENEDYCPRDGAILIPPPVQDDSPIVPEDGSPAAAPVNDGAVYQTDRDQQHDEDDACTTASVSSEKSRKIADFLSRIKLGGTTNGAEASPTEDSHADVGRAVLPKEAQDNGWHIHGPMICEPGIDVWRIEREASGELHVGRFHRFLTGGLTTSKLYRRLQKTTSDRLPSIIAHGTVDAGGARRDFELVEAPADAGITLAQYCANNAPSEAQAIHLMGMLSYLLTALLTVRVRPMCVDPDQTTISEEGCLALQTASALHDTKEDGRYRPEISRTALISRIWTAPELIHGNRLSPNAAVFSVGQILARAVWGKPCSPADLQTGAVPFNTLSNDRLARVLMGCLWPRSSGRWTVQQLRDAVAAKTNADLPPTSPWESLAPEASSTSFSFNGIAYWRLETLLTDAFRPGNWKEATTQIGEILDWADSTAWAGQARLMRDELEQGRSPDYVLVSLTRTVLPATPATWRHLDMAADAAGRSLQQLAQGALKSRSDDAATLHELFDADLRGAFVANQQ